MPQTHEIIQGTVVSLAFGGNGIVRQDGMVIFIPFTAPGDVVKARIVQLKKNHAVAELVEVLNPSPDRIRPRCPYFGSCGGCQLQHLNSSAQLTYKRQAIIDALQRVGGITNAMDVRVEPADPVWFYRKHVLLHLRWDHGGLKIGYVGVDNQTVLEIRECPIFTEQAPEVFADLRKTITQLNLPPQIDGKATLIKSGNCFIADLHFERDFKWREPELGPLWQGVRISSPRKEMVYGSVVHEITFGSIGMQITPGVFLQNHPSQSAKIYQAIADKIGKGASGNILDVYCGIGILTLALAQYGMTVAGIESNPRSIELARENAYLNGISHADFYTGQAEDLLPKLLEHYRPHTVIVNPPRTGLDERVVTELLQSDTKQVFYVSCMPATLARDLKRLSEKYHLAECCGFDMFPQTAHVETLVRLEKR